jgi:hypothetical protein
MFVPYVVNGQGFGPQAEAIAGCHFDQGLMRPYFDDAGRRCVSVNTGKFKKDAKSGLLVPVKEKVRIKDLDFASPVLNATTLRKDEWIYMDTVVREAVRNRLRAWADIMATNPYGGFNAMGSMTLEYETMGDAFEAITDMDGLTDARNDTPQFGLRSIPLPLHHVDFWFSDRQLSASRNKGQPLNLRAARLAGRKLAERVEKLTIGLDVGIKFGPTDSRYEGDSQVFGYLNHPDRIIKDDMPVPNGTNASAIIAAVMELRELMYQNHFYGPFVIYTSTDYDLYLDSDYILTGGNVSTQTLRERLLEVENIGAIRRLDWLDGTSHPFTMIMVCMTDDVVQAINGMDVTTWQWDSKAGWRKNFMVACIQQPLLTANSDGVLGVAIGTTE